MNITHQGALDLGSPVRVRDVLLTGFMEILILAVIFMLFFSSANICTERSRLPECVLLSLSHGGTDPYTISNYLAISAGAVQSPLACDDIVLYPGCIFFSDRFEKEPKAYQSVWLLLCDNCRFDAPCQSLCWLLSGCHGEKGAHPHSVPDRVDGDDAETS